MAQPKKSDYQPERQDKALQQQQRNNTAHEPENVQPVTRDKDKSRSYNNSSSSGGMGGGNL